MTHTFEFVAKIKDGRIVHQHYKGKTSRHAKVSVKIFDDLYRVYGIRRSEIEEFYLKPVKQ